MREINRAVHIDFHTMPGIEDFGENFTAAEVAESLKNANIDYVNFFARCNIGFSYYPTKLGIPYPGLSGDLLGDMIEECHKRDIGISAYLNGGVNHELLNRRPEFAKIGTDGRVRGEEKVWNNFFRTPCFNTEYRKYLYDEIKEIAAKKPDGIFVDCMILQSCCCPSCTEKMLQKGIDINDDMQVKKFAYDTLIEVCGEIREIVPQNMRLYINSFPYDALKDYVSHAEIECLPTGGWGYDFFPTLAPYYRNFSDDLVYMTGKFVGDWGEFGGRKHKASMENDVYDALLYGYKPSVGDHMHPRDGLDKKLYENIGEIFGFVKNLEKYTKGSHAVCEAAIIKNKFKTENVLNDKYGIDGEESIVGACRLMAELKICHDVIDEDMDFSKYKLIIIPENIEITEKLEAKLKSFDGSVISAGDSLNNGGFWDFIDEFEDDGGIDNFYGWDGEVFACMEKGIKMKSRYSISDRVEPYFERRWDGRHGYFYIPDNKPEGYCAVARKDNKVHIAFNIFTAYRNKSASFHKELIKDLTDSLLTDRMIKAEKLPQTAKTSLMEKDNKKLLQIKVSYPECKSGRGIVEEHNILPAGREIAVKGEYKEVTSRPECKTVESSIKDGYTYIKLPEITGYAIFELK